MSLTQLTMWLQHALRRIHGSLSRERRLAGVTCLLVAVFICCYLPFWTVYMCLVRREGGFDKQEFSHFHLDVRVEELSGCCETSVKLCKLFCDTFLGVILLFLCSFDCQILAILRVVNFGINYLRHFFIIFKKFCAHLAANFLNFP